MLPAHLLSFDPEALSPPSAHLLPAPSSTVVGLEDLIVSLACQLALYVYKYTTFFRSVNMVLTFIWQEAIFFP
jgi:hypothetical protein